MIKKIIIIIILFSVFVSNINDKEVIVDTTLVLSANEISNEDIAHESDVDLMISQINKSLNSDLTEKGNEIVNYSLELGVDPYLITAIILHETGCSYNCSNLVKKCNNVGGMKGNSCGGYMLFPSLDEGIWKMIENIKYNYIDKGLDTPSKIGVKYASSTSWANKIENYINEIKSK